MTGARGLAVRCEEVVHIYRRGDTEVVALRGVDLDVAPGEAVAVYGPSGCGKSTLIGLLGGLLPPSAGQAWLGDREIGRMSPRDLLRLRAGTVATVLQGAGRNLLPYATPLQNVEFARRAVGRARRRELPTPAELLDRLGLGAVAHIPVARLSGGEQQRVAVVAAVAPGPGLLLADEPTSQLDAPSRDAVLDVLQRVNADGTTIIAVTHDPEVGERLGRTVTMRFGRVGQTGEGGREYTVIGRDGGLQLPDRYLEAWPPGTLVDVVPDGDDLRIRRRRTGGPE
jgi:ABC-type lipoprotein export system ATPase subunit